MLMKLAALSQAIQQIGQQYPNATQGVQMMLQGLRLVQAAAMAQQAPAPAAAPPTG